MVNDVLVELMRGNLVESFHRGAYAVCDGDGKLVASSGDYTQPVFPRSAIKLMQAMYLMESGAADAYQLTDEELALACSSHSAQPEHVALAQKMLAKAGLSEDDLECGAHWSFDHKTLLKQVKSGIEPSQAHNNCSGKHAGFLCAACHTGIDFNGYVNREHEVQKIVADHVFKLTGAKMTDENCGVDGCSIPTYAMPLQSMASGFAKMASGKGLTQTQGEHAKRLLKANMNAPFYVAGSDRACTKFMEMAPGRIYTKTGAEGVYGAILPELALGIALKIDDGTTRAAEVAIAKVIANCLGDSDPAYEKLIGFANRSFSNWNKVVVGQFKA